MTQLGKYLARNLLRALVELHRMAERSRSLLLGVTVALSGCDDGPLAIQYETEHLRIGTNTFMCQGDLVELEDHIAFVEDDLGIKMEGIVDVYVWDSAAWVAGAHECAGPLGTEGCIFYRARAIYSSEWALKHELVHAIVNKPGLESLFNEGIAEGYAAKLATYGYSMPSASIGLNEPDRATATHFVRWLRARWGGRALGELARRGETKFEAIYGVSLAEAEAMYLAEISTIYPPFRDCYGPEFSADSAGWSTDAQTDCTSEDTRKAHLSLYATRTLVIPAEGRYSLATNASLIGMYRCEDAPGTFADRLEVSDVPSIYQSPTWQTNWRSFEGPEVHSVNLRRGRYNVRVYTDGYEPSSASVRVWPAVGPGPIDG